MHNYLLRCKRVIWTIEGTCKTICYGRGQTRNQISTNLFTSIVISKNVCFYWLSPLVLAIGIRADEVPESNSKVCVTFIVIIFAFRASFNYLWNRLINYLTVFIESMVKTIFWHLIVRICSRAWILEQGVTEPWLPQATLIFALMSWLASNIWITVSFQNKFELLFRKKRPILSSSLILQQNVAPTSRLR